MEDKKKERIEDLLMKGVRQGVYPGAVALVSKNDKILYFQWVGKRSLSPKPALMKRDTVFDLASLTKPLATTLAIMKLVDNDAIRLDQQLGSLLSGKLAKDKRSLTLRLLLCHSAGLAEWKPFYLKLQHVHPTERKKLLRQLLMDTPLISRPGKEVLYSDLGFMMLEWVIEEHTGTSLPLFLDRYFYAPLSLKKTYLGRPTAFEKPDADQFAATEACPWRNETISGNVHDENAHIVGGYSGHAGLFGIAEEIYSLVSLLKNHYNRKRDDFLKPETVRIFFQRQNVVDGSSWALGWDTPSQPDSSAGRFFSNQTVGHLGYTGTSIWMDLEKDVIVILLTNRVHPSRENVKIRAFRPVFHDTVMEAVR